MYYWRRLHATSFISGIGVLGVLGILEYCYHSLIETDFLFLIILGIHGSLQWAKIPLNKNKIF